ncbi:hypothetical protein GCM10022399_07330 [Terrabacter ginsenosidimutans]|jgi:hypothetical protein|uniref:Uncharacterized protein n=1 Tax=Terrabacter ginsenosidimutans TaxID=490575 RepID=A0ABP7CRP5_9MICO
MTRATIIWFVGAAVVGTVAGGLHLLRSAIGGSHTGLPLAVAAFAMTALAAVMLFHGVMRAAREQDAAAGPPRRPAARVAPVAPAVAASATVAPVAPVANPTDRADSGGRDDDRWAPTEGPDVYTFRGGRPIVERAPRPTRRDRPSRG